MSSSADSNGRETGSHPTRNRTTGETDREDLRDGQLSPEQKRKPSDGQSNVASQTEIHGNPMADGDNDVEGERALDSFEEDTDDLVDRVTDRLVRIERGKVLRRRLKRLFLGLLILLIVGGILLWWAYEEGRLDGILDDLRQWPPLQQWKK